MKMVCRARIFLALAIFALHLPNAKLANDLASWIPDFPPRRPVRGGRQPMPAPPLALVRDSPLVPKARTVLQPRVIAMPDGFFA